MKWKSFFSLFFTNIQWVLCSSCQMIPSYCAINLNSHRKYLYYNMVLWRYLEISSDEFQISGKLFRILFATTAHYPQSTNVQSCLSVVYFYFLPCEVCFPRAKLVMSTGGSFARLTYQTGYICGFSPARRTIFSICSWDFSAWS